MQLSTNTERIVNTTGTGLFNIPALLPSDYSVTITAPGFKEKVFSNLTLNSFQNLALGEVLMEIGTGPATVVDVSAEALALATESAVRDQTIQSKQVTEMPMQGHQYTSLLKLIPGATAANTNGIAGREAGPNGLGDFNINGKGGASVQLNLDGGTNVDHGTDNKATVAASAESIQEVAILANNYQAQYGTRQGAVINVTTKSGTNSWHATLWDYLRNEAFNANTFSNNFQGIARPYYRYNYYGANLGGPILKNRLFFFINQETLRADQGNNSTQSRVPDQFERNGDFSRTILPNGQRPVIFTPGSQAAGSAVPLPNNIIPPSMISPLGKALLNIYPLPNFANNATVNYVNSGPTFTHRWQQSGKIDWNISNNTRAYFRGTYDYERSFGTGAFSFTPTNGSWRRPDRAFAANVTTTLTPNLILENLFSWNKDFVHHGLFNYDLNQISRSKLGLSGLPLAYNNVALQYLGVNNDLFLPALQNTGFTDVAFARFPWFADAPEFQGSSTLSWIHGKHVSKFGIQIILNMKNEYDASTAKGAYDFSVNSASAFDTGYTPANMLTGAINSFQQVDNPAYKFSMYKDTDFFIQDTWKITPKLTLDYGVRFYHLPGERNTISEGTKPAAFDWALWDPKKAPRFYMPAPGNPTRLIDPANPSALLPANVFSALLYSIVPGSGDLLNGVVKVGDSSPLGNPRAILWAPRGGIAYSINSKTVLRAGFGWGYGRPTISQAVNTFENGLANQVDYRMTSFATLQSGALNRISPRNFGANDASLQKPQTIYDYSLSIQRELPMKILMDIGYVGNMQRHQLVNFNLNAVLPGTAYLPQYVDSRIAGNNFAGPVTGTNPNPLAGSRTVDANLMRPFLGMGTLSQISQVGNRHYDSLQLSATKRYSHGFMIQGVYTWSKLMSGTEGPGSPLYNWRDYTGFQANGDRGQNATINYTYEVPKLTPLLGWSKNGVATRVLDGWSLAHIFGVLSGRVLTPTFTLQNSGNTAAVANLNSIMTGSPDIAARIMPTSNPNGIVDTYHNFNTAAFGVPTPGGIGTGSQNYLLTPGTYSNDITVTKAIRITEKYALDIRVSAFNLFNSARFQDVNLAATYKMNGASFAQGYRLLNSPEANVAALLASTPNASSTAQFNTWRTGFGAANLNTPLDPRRLEMVARFKF